MAGRVSADREITARSMKMRILWAGKFECGLIELKFGISHELFGVINASILET